MNISAGDHNGSAGPHHSHFNCDCMEYWTCILNGGTPHTYCGLTDHDVCCFVPDNAAPVGILPTPNRVQCGRKGFDSGKEGEAEFSEWPWHVSNIRIVIHIFQPSICPRDTDAGT